MTGRTHTGRFPAWRSSGNGSRVRSRWPGYVALLLLLAALAGCGETTVRQEPSLTVSGGEPRQEGQVGASPAGEDTPRISVVTHGQASSPFWAIVRTGVEAAQRQMNVQVDYEAPDVYSLQRMIALIDDAVAARPDGLVVLLPRARPGARDPACRQGRHPRHHDQLGQRRVPLARRARARRPARGPRRSRRGPASRARGRAQSAVREPAGRQHRSRRPLRRPGAGDARRRRPLDACSASTTRAPPRPRRSRAPCPPAGSTPSSPPTPSAACRRSRAWRGAAPRSGADRRLRPRPRHAARRAGGQAAVRRRPAALPPGLPAGRHARQPRPLRAAARRRATWSRRERTSSPGRTPHRRSSSASARSAEYMPGVWHVTRHARLVPGVGLEPTLPSRSSAF